MKSQAIEEVLGMIFPKRADAALQSRASSAFGVNADIGRAVQCPPETGPADLNGFRQQLF